MIDGGDAPPAGVWRVFVTTHAPPASWPQEYDPHLLPMALELGMRIYSRPSSYEARFAVSGSDLVSAMRVAAECWEFALSALPLPSWAPTRLTMEHVRPPMAPVLRVLTTTDHPRPGIAAVEIPVYAAAM